MAPASTAIELNMQIRNTGICQYFFNTETCHLASQRHSASRSAAAPGLRDLRINVVDQVSIATNDIHQFDTDKLACYLEDRIPVSGDRWSRQNLPGGQSNLTFMLEAQSGTLRCAAAGELSRRTPSTASSASSWRWLTPPCWCCVPATLRGSDVIGTMFYASWTLRLADLLGPFPRWNLDRGRGRRSMRRSWKRWRLAASCRRRCGRARRTTGALGTISNGRPA